MKFYCVCLFDPDLGASRDFRLLFFMPYKQGLNAKTE